MNSRLFRTMLFLTIILTACSSIQGEATSRNAQSYLVDEDRSECVVDSVPDLLSFDPFYEKYCDADGIPIISSDEVDDLALQQAYYLIRNMLVAVPEIHQELVSNGVYFGVIGKNEMQTTLPEYSEMDSTYWDQRARGLGGSVGMPITSSAEENLLCLRSDRYYGESITIHEFAHTIANLGIRDDFDAKAETFSALYTAAVKSGLWENTYAASNIEEYWAEGVQSYFNANTQSLFTDGVHNHVNTREELAEYDPALYQFISEIFNGFTWTPTCPSGE